MVKCTFSFYALAFHGSFSIYQQVILKKKVPDTYKNRPDKRSNHKLLEFEFQFDSSDTKYKKKKYICLTLICPKLMVRPYLGLFFLLMSILSKFVLALSCLKSSHDHNLCFKNSFWSSPFKPTWFVFVKMPQIIFYQIGSFYFQKSYFWSNHGR